MLPNALATFKRYIPDQCRLVEALAAQNLIEYTERLCRFEGFKTKIPDS